MFVCYTTNKSIVHGPSILKYSFITNKNVQYLCLEKMYACICTLVKQLFLFCIIKLLRTKTNSAFLRKYILVFTTSKLLESYQISHIHVYTRTLPSHVSAKNPRKSGKSQRLLECNQ